MSATYSIQGADLSTRQEGKVKSAVELIGIYQSYDWIAEADEQKILAANGKDNCPAGLSIVREPYVFLHLCPRLDGTVLTHCIHTKPSKFLGVFKSQKTTDLFAEHLS